MKEKCNPWLCPKFREASLSACQILALRSSSEELRKVFLSVDSLNVIISIEYLRAWPRSESLKVLIFNFRSDLLMHWHCQPTVTWTGSGGPSSTRNAFTLRRPAPRLKCESLQRVNNISTGRIKFLSWQMKAPFTLFSEFFSPFLHSTWFAIGIVSIFSLRN